MKVYDLYSYTAAGIEHKYFFIREKNDRNGNPRYRFFIQDPPAGAMLEKVMQSYRPHEDARYFIDKLRGVK